MKEQSAETQSETYLSIVEERSISRRDGRREAVETSVELGAGVRVARGGRIGFASGGGADLRTLQGLWRRAVEQLPYAEAEPGRRLPQPLADAEDPVFEASLQDETLFGRPWEALEERLGQAEAAGRAGGRVLRADFTESRGEVVVAGTNGVLARERSGFASVSVAVAAEDDGQTQVGEGFRLSRRFDDLNCAAAGGEAARRAAAVIGARRVRAGRRAVLFEPWVAAEFLELLADLFSAEEVQGGRSLLAGRLGDTVASPLVTLRDDPRIPGGAASARFDAEGMPTRDKALVDRGVLREYLHDSATAARAGMSSNGCSVRGSWRGLPGPGPSNFSLVPGLLTRAALLKDTRDGLLLMEVLGTHMVDPVSGEFSVGVSGYEVEKGAFARPFKGAMISGNLLDLLGRVDAVADDLVRTGSFGSPTFRVSALDVA
ncbi:MAG: hypothetical protein A2X40_01035 [Elusimicrobia bacterium GWC2_65_9]|nr:MAG: hypothetical protein A2X37_10610 [Elusimicrobia bacterium GWA2_66_18]OGR77222.1 MAG: hypothetical protein A2X40_01035 [Elusimicrobia bacterium GWC2_65_9]